MSTKGRRPPPDINCTYLRAFQRELAESRKDHVLVYVCFYEEGPKKSRKIVKLFLAKDFPAEENIPKGFYVAELFVQKPEDVVKDYFAGVDHIPNPHQGSEPEYSKHSQAR